LFSRLIIGDQQWSTSSVKGRFKIVECFEADSLRLYFSIRVIDFKLCQRSTYKKHSKAYLNLKNMMRNHC